MNLRRPRTPFWPLTITTTALAAAILAFASVPPQEGYQQPVLLPAESSAEQTPTDSPTSDVQTDDVSTVETPSVDTDEADAPSTPQQLNTLTIPAIGFNLPLADLSVNGAGSITPPDFTHGFVLSDWGVGRAGDPDAGSIYVITHSKRDGTGTGNELFNTASSAATVKAGDNIYALGEEWTVTGSWHESKEGLPENERLWSNTPNTLYLVTCLQIGDGVSQSTDNFIIEAKLAH